MCKILDAEAAASEAWMHGRLYREQRWWWQRPCTFFIWTARSKVMGDPGVEGSSARASPTSCPKNRAWYSWRLELSGAWVLLGQKLGALTPTSVVTLLRLRLWLHRYARTPSENSYLALSMTVVCASLRFLERRHGAWSCFGGFSGKPWLFFYLFLLIFNLLCKRFSSSSRINLAICVSLL
jgi:hypothetical protein